MRVGRRTTGLQWTAWVGVGCVQSSEPGACNDTVPSIELSVRRASVISGDVARGRVCRAVTLAAARTGGDAQQKR
jgi:hypothetical protein